MGFSNLDLSYDQFMSFFSTSGEWSSLAKSLQSLWNAGNSSSFGEEFIILQKTLCQDQFFMWCKLQFCLHIFKLKVTNLLKKIANNWKKGSYVQRNRGFDSRFCFGTEHIPIHVNGKYIISGLPNEAIQVWNRLIPIICKSNFSFVIFLGKIDVIICGYT